MRDSGRVMPADRKGNDLGNNDDLGNNGYLGNNDRPANRLHQRKSSKLQRISPISDSLSV
jgi:hypothetical protein